MSAPPVRPVIGVSACLKLLDGSPFHSVQRNYVDAMTRAVAGLPVILPAIGDALDITTTLGFLDGLLLTGSPSNVAPEHYAGAAARPENLADPDRDATTLPLARAAIEVGLPVLAICRGIQELNVALGGSLHQHVHELDGRFDHRSNKSLPRIERYEPCHPVLLEQGGRLQTICGGAERFPVNSLHGQGLDRLAPGLVVEARALDGTIEAVTLPSGPGFVLGVQWHPEYRPLDDPWSRQIFIAFGDAARAYAARKATGGEVGRAAPTRDHGHADAAGVTHGGLSRVA